MSGKNYRFIRRMQTENSYTPTVCDNTQEKEPLQFVSQEIKRAFWFLITLSLLGLQFPPAYAFLLMALISSYTRDKYDFLIQLTIIWYGFGFFNHEEVFHFKVMDIALVISMIAAIKFYHCDERLKRLLIFTFAYFAVLFVFAFLSDEVLSIQMRHLREYMMIIYFMFPLLVLRGCEFDIKVFYRKFITYAFLVALFYCIDCFILGANILVPRTYMHEELYSTYYKIYHWGIFFRKYPPGLLLLALCIFPMVKFYTLRVKHIAVFALALIATRTISVIGGIVFTILCFMGNFKMLLKYMCFAIVLFFIAYYVDEKMGGELRIVQLVEQFEALSNPDDVEKLADFGTGRMAQLIPKVALLWSMDRQYIGFGFLSRELTTNPKYIIENPFYIGTEDEVEVATGVEISVAQTILDIGIIGLILQTFYYLAIYFWVLRPMSYSKSYLMTLLCISIIGIGGFSGLGTGSGLLLLGLNIAIIFLADKQLHKNEDYESNT